MKIQYNVQIPPKPFQGRNNKSEEVLAIEDFLTSGNAKNMCFQYDTPQEAKRKQDTIRYHRNKWNKEHSDRLYDSYRVDNCVYIVRPVVKKV